VQKRINSAVRADRGEGGRVARLVGRRKHLSEGLGESWGSELGAARGGRKVS